MYRRCRLSVGRSDGCLACVLLIVCVRTLFRACAQNRDGRSNAKEKGASECVCVCVWSIVAFHMRQTNASKYARIRFIQLICVMVCVEKWNINWKYVQIVNAYAKRGQRRIYAAAAATTSTHVFVFIYKRATTTMESALIIWYSMWRLSRSPHTSIKSNRIPTIVRGGGGSDRSSIALPDHHIVLHAHYRCTTWRLGETKRKKKKINEEKKTTHTNLARLFQVSGFSAFFFFFLFVTFSHCTI